MKSDTPRTDAIASEFSLFEDAMIPPDFCRQLERELNEANQRITTLNRALKAAKQSGWLEGYDDGFKDGRLRERREHA